MTQNLVIKHRCFSWNIIIGTNEGKKDLAKIRKAILDGDQFVTIGPTKLCVANIETVKLESEK